MNWKSGPEVISQRVCDVGLGNWKLRILAVEILVLYHLLWLKRSYGRRLITRLSKLLKDFSL